MKHPFGCFEILWSTGAKVLSRFVAFPRIEQELIPWGGFCAKGKTSLFCFRDNMTGPFYVDIIEKHFPKANKMFGKNWRLQQDNDPKHTSRVAKKFLQENVPTVIDWPSNNSDLNPIENL